MSHTYANPMRMFGESKPTPEIAASDLGLHLLRMAMAGVRALDSMEINPNRSTLAQQEIFWVYLNLANRSLFGLFGPAVRDRAMQHMDTMLPDRMTEVLCSSWPEDLKKKHVQEFADNMRSAEAKYGNLKVTGLPREDDIFMQCALNVVRHTGHLDAWESALSVCMVLMKTYADMPMCDCVRSLGNALRD